MLVVVSARQDMAKIRGARLISSRRPPIPWVPRLESGLVQELETKVGPSSLGNARRAMPRDSSNKKRARCGLYPNLG